MSISVNLHTKITLREVKRQKTAKTKKTWKRTKDFQK